MVQLTAETAGRTDRAGCRSGICDATAAPVVVTAREQYGAATLRAFMRGARGKLETPPDCRCLRCVWCGSSVQLLHTFYVRTADIASCAEQQPLHLLLTLLTLLPQLVAATHVAL